MVDNDEADSAGADPVVRDSAEDHRYEISVGGELAGFAEYVDRSTQRIFRHTEIDEGFAGRGLASKLISHALTDTRNTGKRIVAVCPFVAGYLNKHHDFADITDPATPAIVEEMEQE